MKLLAYIFFIPFYLFWLGVSIVLAFCGSLLPGKKVNIDMEEVREVLTVCKILNNKGLITDAEYDFETTRVASYYDDLTFRGYRFILGPLMSFLQKVHYFDDFILFLVKKWMHVHRHIFDQVAAPNPFYIGLTKVCVRIARGVGRTLRFLSRMAERS